MTAKCLSRSDPQGIALQLSRHFKETAPVVISSDDWGQGLIVNEAS